jgi:peptidoglycan/xylan/chitin deacetylase (PgdA/CDA1 family)
MQLVDRDVPGPRRDFVGYGRKPPRVVWPDQANVAINLVVNYEEGSEYSMPAGDGRNEGLAEINYVLDPKYRDLCAESVYEYGSRAGIWRLMRIFDEYDVKVTFFACAVALDRNRQVGAWLRESGHEPCSHGWRWLEHWTLTREQESEYMRRAIELIQETCGQRPLGWYCRYGPSVYTRELVVEEGGFVYDSDAYNDDLPYFTEVGSRQHLIVPYTLVYNDGRYAMTQGFGGPSDFFDVCKRGLDELWLEGERGLPKMMSIGLHPRWAGQAGRADALREFIEYALAKDKVWFTRRIDIARWWLDHHAEWQDPEL